MGKLAIQQRIERPLECQYFDKTEKIQAGIFGDHFLVVDNDIVLHKHFPEGYQKLHREGCGLYLSQYGGLVLLGSSEWQKDGERWGSMTKSEYLSGYDAPDRTLGSFTVLHNEAGAELLLQMRSQMPNAPFDHSLYQVALRKGLVSVALPNLVIVDHRHHESTVNGERLEGHKVQDRIRRNKWNTTLYDWRL